MLIYLQLFFYLNLLDHVIPYVHLRALSIQTQPVIQNKLVVFINIVNQIGLLISQYLAQPNE